MNQLWKKPSAWVPILLSLGIFTMLMVTLALSPTIERAEDEGIEAHLFQLWLVVEIFLIGYFGLTALPRAPKDAFLILVLQIALVLLTCAPVFLLQL